MNVPTISMRKEDARKKLREYRRALHRSTDAEYEAAAIAYEALAEGTPILELSKAMQYAGFDSLMRPKLAIARADRKRVEFHWEWNHGFADFDSSELPRWDGRRHGSLSVRVELGRRHGRKERGQNGEFNVDIRAYAMVPMIPADVRARVKGPRREQFILWEVDRWEDVSRAVQPDRDPYLLRHLGGELYAVLAEWNLSEVERAVMAGRAR